MARSSTSSPPSLRDTVLHVARRRFLANGLDGLAVRALADEAGCTTMAVYTHFGGKDGLIQTFFDEGFERLAAAQRDVPANLPPRDRVVELCLAYRRIAHDFPHHYDLMLGAKSAVFTPTAESRQRALATITFLADVLRPLQPGRTRSRERAEDHAHEIIAYCHGWVTLERAGLWRSDPRQDRAFVRGVRALLADAPDAQPIAGHDTNP